MSMGPTKPLAPPRTAAEALARQKDPQLQAQEKEKLRQACRMMETQFLGLLWKEMRKTLPKEKLLHGGFGEEIFTDLLDQAVAESSAQGRGVGLAAMLERQLSQSGITRPDQKFNRAAYGNPSEAMTLPAEGRVSSPYGLRQHPLTGAMQEHQGVDLAAPLGSPVRAMKDGQVIFAGAKGSYGNLVIMEHLDGEQTYYGHLDEIGVKEGQQVRAGQKVATVGSTGRSTGPHLHFEVRNASGEPVDPASLLAKAADRIA